MCIVTVTVFSILVYRRGQTPVTSNKAITCAELALDVSPKTQRVILKKKVREPRTLSLE